MSRQLISGARRATFEILRKVQQGKAEPASLLHAEPTHGLKDADHDLATEIVYGVLRWQNRLDYVLEAHAKRAPAKIDLALLIALRIGLYQIQHLSRVPSRAAVDESVKLARTYGRRGSHGFVNAVLRSICRNPDQPRLPSRTGNPLGYLTVTLSHPEWLAGRTLNRLGMAATEARFERHNRPPPQDLRLELPLRESDTPDALEREGVAADPFPLVPGCLRVRTGNPTRTSLYRSGSIFIQEAGSQLIPYLLGLRTGDRVLDACAAPGAKATEMASWNHPGLVVALERRSRRAALLATVSQRHGCENVVPVIGDAGNLPFQKPFDTILLDAPCSSLGTLARNPDIKWRLKEADLLAHAHEQSRLLESCAHLLAPGGRLVYATCSTEHQ